MKNIIKSSLLLLCSICLLTSCDDDMEHNPTLKDATTFVLNTPGISANNVVDLENSKYVQLTCSQPNYGFPTQTQYTVEVSLDPKMEKAVTLSDKYTTTQMQVDANELASTLTNMALDAGKKEADFPLLNLPVYFRAHAVVTTKQGTEIESTKMTSNIVCINKVNLKYSLPAVKCPENIYLVGNFCGWDWSKSLKMVEVYGSRDNGNSTAKFWHMVYIDDSGIKFNTATAWNGGEQGFAGITIDEKSELGSTIKDNGGNISSSKPGWYLMVVTATVEGRDIKYVVTFNKPEVWLMGPVVGNGDWKELEPGWMFTAPTTADGEFVSPALAAGVPGGDGDGVRIYVKVPGYDWWKTEFIVGLDAKNISYRGTGGDQDRVAASAGQKVYLNFGTETGEIK